MTTSLTILRLRELLNYDPQTGRFIWLIKPSRKILVGSEAGWFNTVGYRVICIDRKHYYAHRLAWFYVHETWPTSEVDHKNGIRDDNRLENLREATHAHNGRNLKLKINNTSGYAGVHWLKKNRKWWAYIDVNYKRQHLGFFSELSDAILARQQGEQKFFGKFARITISP